MISTRKLVVVATLCLCILAAVDGRIGGGIVSGGTMQQVPQERHLKKSKSGKTSSDSSQIEKKLTKAKKQKKNKKQKKQKKNLEEALKVNYLQELRVNTSVVANQSTEDEVANAHVAAIMESLTSYSPSRRLNSCDWADAVSGFQSGDLLECDIVDCSCATTETAPSSNPDGVVVSATATENESGNYSVITITYVNNGGSSNVPSAVAALSNAIIGGYFQGHVTENIQNEGGGVSSVTFTGATSTNVPPITRSPTGTPTVSPTPVPTATPTATPSAAPSASPTASPSAAPTAAPSDVPTATPTGFPTATPTTSSIPTEPPFAVDPQGIVTNAPTTAPTSSPTMSATTSGTSSGTSSFSSSFTYTSSSSSS